MLTNTSNLLFVLLTLIGAFLLNRYLLTFIKIPKQLKTARTRTIYLVFSNSIKVTIYLVTLYIILTILGVDLTPLITSAGIIGIAVGFGARALIEDVISGIFLLTQNSISVGDYVRVADSEGNIEFIGLRTLTLKDRTGAIYIIPNSQVKTIKIYPVKKKT